MSDYPELRKMESLQEKSQVIGEFLEWLGSGEAHEDVLGECPVYLSHRCLLPRYGYEEVPWEDLDLEDIVQSDFRTNPFSYNIEALLAKFFGVDLVQAEAEKREILDSLKRAPL
jgi:hypothetical protein